MGAEREGSEKITENPTTNWDKAMKEGCGELFDPNRRGSSVLSALEKASFSTALKKCFELMGELEGS